MPNFSQPAADRRCNSLCRGLGKSVFMNPFLPSPWETIVAAVVPGDRVLGNGESPAEQPPAGVFFICPLLIAPVMSCARLPSGFAVRASPEDKAAEVGSETGGVVAKPWPKVTEGRKRRQFGLRQPQVLAKEPDLHGSEGFARGDKVKADRLPEAIKVLVGYMLFAIDGLDHEAVEQVNVILPARRVMQRLTLERQQIGMAALYCLATTRRIVSNLYNGPRLLRMDQVANLALSHFVRA